ncbi:hypothetical protein E2320_007871 [Naja naja]|nr:hypothetical protein E2320_007871 [Naja naja]
MSAHNWADVRTIARGSCYFTQIWRSFGKDQDLSDLSYPGEIQICWSQENRQVQLFKKIWRPVVSESRRPMLPYFGPATGGIKEGVLIEQLSCSKRSGDQLSVNPKGQSKADPLPSARRKGI